MIGEFRRLGKRSLSILVLVLACAAVASAQTTPSDGWTPSSLARGTHPLGSYSGSGVDQVNLYNGNLAVNFPLAKLVGRNGTSVSVQLSYNSKLWSTEESVDVQGPNPMFYRIAQFDEWDGTPRVGGAPGWLITAGRMVKRAHGSGEMTLDCDPSPDREDWRTFYHYTSTRFTFVAPDGAEYEFRDVQRGGDLHYTETLDCGYDDSSRPRGRVFKTADGTGAVFISDEPIYDSTRLNGPVTKSAFGYVILRDGTRFRIDRDLVVWQMDRNGNKVTFGYDPSGRLTSVTDSLGRIITVQYFDLAQGAPESVCAQVTVAGVDGVQRQIKVYSAKLGQTLRGDFGTGPSYEDELFGDTVLGAGNGLDNAHVTFNPRVISRVEYPSLQKWGFKYNRYGEVARIETPLGGATEYDAAMGLANVSGGQCFWRCVSARRSKPDGMALEGFTTYTNLFGSAAFVSEKSYDAGGVLLRNVDHYFGGDPETGSSPFYGTPSGSGFRSITEGKEIKTVFRDAAGAALRTVETTWANRATVPWTTITPDPSTENDPRVTLERTSLETGASARVEYDYDAYNNVTAQRSYDFGGTVPLREVRRTYKGAPYTDTANNIVSLVETESVYGPNGSTVTLESQTTYEYDVYDTTAFHAPLVTRAFPASDPRGDANDPRGADFNGTSWTLRGNVTAATRGGPATTSSTSRTQYDVAGNVVRKIGPLASQTTLPLHAVDLTYDSLHSAFPIATTLHVTQNGSVANLVSSRTYDFSTGLVVTETGYNNDLYSYEYEDPYGMDRLTAEIRPGDMSVGGMGRTAISYSPPGESPAWLESEVTLDSGRVVRSRQYFDGFGRGTSTENLSDPDGTARTDTRYDGLGRLWLVSNPYRVGLSSATDGWTRTSYDFLGRVTQIASFDNPPATPPTANEAADTGAATTVYVGNLTTVTDQAGRQQRSVVDGLGRMAQMIEDPSGLNYVTSYVYDGRNNLRSVTQGAQSRTFTYDALGRLTQAVQPEGGTASYTYDVASNRLTRQDARGASFKTTCAYDELNRILTKDYANTSAIPDAKYVYDGSSLPAGATAPPFGRPNTTGRLYAILTSATGAQQTNQSATGSFYGYDAGGRIVNYSQWLDNQHYVSSTEYNSSSSATKFTYPSGAFVLNTLNGAGQLLSVSKTTGGAATQLASDLHYTPSGALSRERFGGGSNPTFYHTLGYNSREQTTSILLGPTAGGSDILGLGYVYGRQQDSTLSAGGSIAPAQNNGYVARQTISLGAGTPIEQDYAYDALNRLVLAKEYFESGGGGGCTTSPAVPTNLSASAAGATQINLAWTNNATSGANAATSQTLERTSNGGATWTVVSSTIAGTATSYSDSGLTSGTTYQYRVKASNACGASGYAMSNAVTLGSGGCGAAPSAPSALSASAVSASQVNLSWTDNQGAGANAETGFTVERSSNGGSSWSVVSAAVAANAVNYSDTTVSAGTSYHYRVKAQNGCGSSTYATFGPVTTPSGATDYALGLSGNTFSAYAASSTSLALTGTLTVEAWIRPDALNAKQVIVSKRQTQANGGGYELRLNASNQLVFATYDSTGTVTSNATSTATLTAADVHTWVHVSGSLNTSNGRMRVCLKGVVETPVTNGLAPGTGTTRVQLGRAVPSGTAQDLFAGRIDEVRISNTERYSANFTPGTNLQSDGSTKALWKMNDYASNPSTTTAADASGFNNNLTLTNVVVPWPFGVTAAGKIADELGDDSGDGVDPVSIAGPEIEAEDVQQKVAAATTPSWSQDWTYDRWGNRSWGASGTANGPQLGINTANNQLNSVGSEACVYDPCGNLTSQGTTKTYAYDAENGMWKAVVGASTTYYVYDGRGRRVKRSTGTNVTRFVYDATGRLIAEYTTSTATPSKEFAYGANGLLATTEGTNGSDVRYAVVDHLGSPRLWINKSGSILSRHDYYPFGEEIFAGAGGRTTAQGFASSLTGTQGDGARHQFTSKERDAETGMDFFNARYYAGAQGRFTSVDPLPASGRVAKPQSWNRYAYVFNNPLNLVDPHGLAENDPDSQKDDSSQQVEPVVVNPDVIAFAQREVVFALLGDENKLIEVLVPKELMSALTEYASETYRGMYEVGLASARISEFGSVYVDSADVTKGSSTNGTNSVEQSGGVSISKDPSVSLSEKRGASDTAGSSNGVSLHVQIDSPRKAEAELSTNLARKATNIINKFTGKTALVSNVTDKRLEKAVLGREFMEYLVTSVYTNAAAAGARDALPCRSCP